MKDVIIIGGGPAAMSAGVYSARKKLKTLLITKDFGGHVAYADKIENYLGFKSISGIDLSNAFQQHLLSYDVEILQESVENVYQDKNKVIVKLKNGKSFQSKIAIVASGSERKKLDVKGEKELFNKGVTYCSVCDGPLFQNQKIAVVGGGYAGTKSALYLSKIAKKVYILEPEKKLKSEQIIIDELKKSKNVEILLNAKISEILGEESVTGLIYSDLKSKKQKQINIEGVAIEIGIIPNSKIVDVEKDDKGFIKVNEKMQTSSDRIFAVGDINNKGPKQVAVAVGQGCTAVLEAEVFFS
jgi:thioredoxin-disulfide reductase